MRPKIQSFAICSLNNFSGPQIYKKLKIKCVYLKLHNKAVFYHFVGLIHPSSLFSKRYWLNLWLLISYIIEVSKTKQIRTILWWTFFLLTSLNLLILHQDLVLVYLKIQNNKILPQQNKIKSKNNAIIANKLNSN